MGNWRLSIILLVEIHQKNGTFYDAFILFVISLLSIILWVREQAGGKGVGFGFVCLER
jgi:hypothetical protein